jgi:hypothetical protein
MFFYFLRTRSVCVYLRPTFAVLKVSKDEFLFVLDAYIAEVKPDPCFPAVRAHYAARSTAKTFVVDDEGSPVPQLQADARATGQEAFHELPQAARRANLLIVLRPEQLQNVRLRPDSFVSSGRALLAAISPLADAPIVLSQTGGLRQGLAAEQARLVEAWRQDYLAEQARYRQVCRQTGVKGYKELSLFTFAGFLGGLGLGAVLDALGFSTSAIGEWAVRTLSGEGEDLAEGTWVLRSRLRRGQATEAEAEEDEDEEPTGSEAAEAYGTGKVLGMAFPWAVDAVSRLAGVDVRAPEGSYVAYFYSLADQIGANLSGLRHHVRRTGGLRAGLSSYFHDPVMVASLTVITLPLAMLYLVRSAGWRPDLLVLAAVEGILLNLCWVPPLVAWFWDRRLQRGLRAVTQRYVQVAAEHQA